MESGSVAIVAAEKVITAGAAESLASSLPAISLAVAFVISFGLAPSAFAPCALELRMGRRANGFHVAMAFTAPALPGVSRVR